MASGVAVELTLNLTPDQVRDLEQQAKLCHLSMERYCQEVLACVVAERSSRLRESDRRDALLSDAMIPYGLGARKP